MGKRLHKYSIQRHPSRRFNEAAFAAPESKEKGKLAIWLSGILLAAAITTFKLVVSRTHGS